MSIKYICDRCEGQHDNLEDVIAVTIPHQASGHSGFDHVGGFNTFKRDFCAKCVKSLHEWLNVVKSQPKASRS